MKIIAKTGNLHKHIKVIERDGAMLKIAIDDKEYTLDVEKVENGVYSVLHNGNSLNMEIIASEKKNHYTVNTRYQLFDIEIAPAMPETEGLKRSTNGVEHLEAPMPGKVVAIKVQVGDIVKDGETLVILSAMKMENELKSPLHGKVTRIGVKKDDLVKDGQMLVEISTDE